MRPHGSKWKKLSAADVAEMRLRSARGENRSKLAREYGVRPQTVDYHVAQGKRLEDPYAAAIEAACAARRRGDRSGAADHLRQAADVVEGKFLGFRVHLAAQPAGVAGVMADPNRPRGGVVLHTESL